MATNRYTAATNLTKVFRYIRSITVSETAGGGVVRVQLRDGNDTTNDPVLVSVACASSAQASQSFTPPLFFPSGVRLEIPLATGTAAITLNGY